MSDPTDYPYRAQECCRNFAEARSTAEKHAWLTIAENWLILARDGSAQGLAQNLIEAGREHRSGAEMDINTPKQHDPASILGRVCSLRSLSQ